jgi:cytochrome c
MSRPSASAALGLALAISWLLLAGACRGRSEPTPGSQATGGDPDRGRELIELKNCGACHTIPGVRGARGVVGPPLTSFARRGFVGGEVPNTPVNLVRWIRDPHQVEARTAMPALGLDERQARDVAAFLYTLR